MQQDMSLKLALTNNSTEQNLTTILRPIVQKQLFTNWQHTYAKQHAPIDTLCLTLK